MVCYNRLRCHEGWKKVLRGVRNIPKGKGPRSIVITGKQNVGKSVLSRFVVNSLLSKYGKVAYLETDLGQPELNEPGSVAIHIVSRPLLQPAHSLINQEGVQCIGKYFCAGVTPTVHPTLYIESVKNAVQDFCDYNKRTGDWVEKIPLVVNTMGWINGMGLKTEIQIISTQKRQ